MFPNVDGPTAVYLANLEKNQNQMTQVETEMSSGLRVQQASDDPLDVPQILELKTELNQNQQIQTNLGQASAELNTADSALQTAISAVSNALTLGLEGASSTATTEQQNDLAQQVEGIQQTLVNVANTQVNGRYIFSGDEDDQPAYQLDPSNTTEGVTQVATGSATRVIADATGTTITVAKTAQQIFDPQDQGTGQPASNNTFAAIQLLITGLTSGNQGDITQATTNLQSASTYLNDQLAFYGNAENQIASAQDLAQKFQTQQTQELSTLQDADVASLAVQLNLEQVQNQAALSVGATLLQNKNLFSYLG
jgi:flagellar hook-associated protein 3 FlgL